MPMNQPADFNTLQNKPTTVAGFGITDASQLGIGQSWQGVARSAGTTYYNTTDKPIVFRYQVTASSASTVTINGVAMSSGATVTGQSSLVTHIIPPGASYSFSPGAADIYELR